MSLSFIGLGRLAESVLVVADCGAGSAHCEEGEVSAMIEWLSKTKAGTEE